MDRSLDHSQRSLSCPSIGMPAAVGTLVFLVLLIVLAVYLYGEDGPGGPIQIALITSGLIAALVGSAYGYTWKEMESAVAQGITVAIPAVLILMLVGSLIGSWILSGTVPTMIYYGLKLVSPQYFYPACCLVCALTSLSTGSAWSTAGTVGVGLMGTAIGLGLEPEIAAGAIISGSYFGDKMSPLSDTTNLAPAVAGGELFSHIRHMMWTTIPGFIIALVMFAILGASAVPEGDGVHAESMMLFLQTEFNIGLHLLLPMVLVIILAACRKPAFPSIAVATLVGAIFAVIFQAQLLDRMALAMQHGDILNELRIIWGSLFDGYQSTSANEDIRTLLSRGGMSSMLDTVWLVLSALFFGSIMDKIGALEKIVAWTLRRVKSRRALVTTTALATMSSNVVASDQYLSIVIPGRMYKKEFELRGLAPKNLSRILEDAGTMTSVLVPWNTCGAFVSAVLGVSTLAYLPYCFFNLLSPIITMIYGMLNFTIEPINVEYQADTTVAN